MEKLSKKRADNSVILSSRKSFPALKDFSPIKVKPTEGAVTARLGVAKSIKFNAGEKLQLVKNQQTLDQKVNEAREMLQTMDKHGSGRVKRENFLQVLKVFGLQAQGKLDAEQVDYKEKLQLLI